jgi:hypothetical protein
MFEENDKIFSGPMVPGRDTFQRNLQAEEKYFAVF